MLIDFFDKFGIAHAPYYVTCSQEVKNNYIFGIPDADLPIQYIPGGTN